MGGGEKTQVTGRLSRWLRREPPSAEDPEDDSDDYLDMENAWIDARIDMAREEYDPFFLALIAWLKQE